MKLRKLLFLLLFLSVSAFGQDRKDYYPIWTYHQDNIDIHGISVGFLSGYSNRNTNTNGVKIELIGNGIIIGMAPKMPELEDISYYRNIIISERINGLSLSPLGTLCFECITNGASLSIVAQFNYEINGLSGAIMFNITRKSNGLQLALFGNFSSLNNGIQIGMFNLAYRSNGLQMGLSNKSIYMSGLQIGIYNSSDNLFGIQLGIWNKNQKRELPLINWNFSQ